MGAPLGVRAALLAAVLVTGCGSTAAPTGSILESPVASVGAPAPSGFPSPSPAIATATLAGHILFTRADNGAQYSDETVFTANADGTHEREVNPPGDGCCPRWWPDGAHIQISASTPDGSRISAAEWAADGSAHRVIPIVDPKLNLGCVVVARSGKRLACEGWDDTSPGRNGLYIVDAADGRHAVRVTDSGTDHDIPMDFSPDGTAVFFLRGSALFTAKVDGGDVRQVSPQGVAVDVVGNAGGRLSPDGKQIVYAVSGAVLLMSADGSDPRQLLADAGGRIAITPTWSPDGQMILLGIDPPGTSADIVHHPENELDVMNADGTHLTSIIASPDFKREPEWVK